jgi:hypothetical protein
VRLAYVSFLALLLVTACESTDITRNIVTCANVVQKITLLEKENEANQVRLKDGVKTLHPLEAAYRLAMGKESEPSKMTVKEWEAKLDEALKKLQGFEDGCGLRDLEKDNASRRGGRTLVKIHGELPY